MDGVPNTCIACSCSVSTFSICKEAVRKRNQFLPFMPHSKILILDREYIFEYNYPSNYPSSKFSVNFLNFCGNYSHFEGARSIYWKALKTFYHESQIFYLDSLWSKLSPEFFLKIFRFFYISLWSKNNFCSLYRFVLD